MGGAHPPAWDEVGERGTQLLLLLCKLHLAVGGWVQGWASPPSAPTCWSCRDLNPFLLCRRQVQVLLYFLQLEAIPAPDSKRQSILFSTEV